MQKIIALKVDMPCERSRRKAMKFATGAQGVTSVELVGEDQMVVTGDGVDPVRLVNVLRKKFRFAKILTVEDVTDQNNGDGIDEEENTGATDPNETVQFLPSGWASHYQFPPPCPTDYYVVYDPYPSDCCLM